MNDPLFEPAYPYGSNIKRGVNRTISHRERLKAQRRRHIEEFAEKLASGMGVKESAEAIGVSGQSGTIYLNAIRDGLGNQAKVAGDKVPKEFRGRADLACAAIARGDW